jgi:hypothetical protein
VLKIIISLSATVGTPFCINIMFIADLQSLTVPLLRLVVVLQTEETIGRGMLDVS